MTTSKITAHAIYNTLSKAAIQHGGALQHAENMGMLPKHELNDGVSYLGYCRNATVAVWRAERQAFEYLRTKFGHTFSEDIKHPEDDNGFDIFVPVGVADE